MTDHALVLGFLADRLEHQTGSDHAHALGDAKALFVIMQTMGLIPASALAQWEQDARTFYLRGQGLTCTIIALRLAVTREHVSRVVKRHQEARRATLRLPALSGDAELLGKVG